LLAFSPDGTRLAVVADGQLRRKVPAGENKFDSPVVPGKVQIWDVATMKPVATLEGHTDRVAALAFSPDGSLLVTGGVDSTARVWDLKTNEATHVIKDHGKEVTAVAFS